MTEAQKRKEQHDAQLDKLVKDSGLGEEFRQHINRAALGSCKLGMSFEAWQKYFGLLGGSDTEGAQRTAWERGDAPISLVKGKPLDLLKKLPKVIKE